MSVTLILSLIGCLMLGFAIGGIYFVAMWRSAELLATGGRTTLAIAIIAGRFALILATLAIVVIHGGALPLLATALGVWIARVIAMRRAKAMAS